MNTFHHYVPAFMDTHPPADIEFVSAAELLRQPVFQRFSDNPRFQQFAFKRAGNIVLAVFDSSYWVVGTTDRPVTDLPEWKE